MLVEGQTEEAFVRDLLEPHFQSAGWWVSYSIVATKVPASGGKHRGGITSWNQLCRDINQLLRDSSISVLTTIVDYYGLPTDSPGMSARSPGPPLSRVRSVEKALAAAVGDPRFLPHLTLHEFEAWVFAAADHLGELMPDVGLADQLHRDVAAAGGAEQINDGVHTAPSKRLQRYCPTYVKTFDGPLAISALGLGGLRSRCPHVDRWLGAIEDAATLVR